MAEERRDEQQAEAEGQPDDQPAEDRGGQMEAVTPPDAEAVGEEIAARRKLEAEAEQAEEAKEETAAEPERPAAETPAAPEAEAPAAPVARQAEDEPGERSAPDGEREVTEDVGDAGETIAEAPAEWVEEGIQAVEHEVSKADETTDVVEEEAAEEKTDRDEAQAGPAARAAAAPQRGTTPGARAAAAPAAPARPPREHRPSRRTQSREERRRRSERRRARRRTIYMILGGSVAAMLILGLILGDVGITPPTPEIPPVGENTGVQAGDIIQPGTEHAGYQHNPPTAGPRFEEPAAWGIHEEQQENEHIVRNLEIGGIVFNHNLTDQAAIEDLHSLVETLTGYPGCYVVHPYAEIPEGTVVVTAWGWRQQFTGVDRSAKREFVTDHRNQRGPVVLGPACGYTAPSATATPVPQETPDPEAPPEQQEAPAGGG